MKAPWAQSSPAKSIPATPEIAARKAEAQQWIENWRAKTPLDASAEVGIHIVNLSAVVGLCIHKNVRYPNSNWRIQRCNNHQW